MQIRTRIAAVVLGFGLIAAGTAVAQEAEHDQHHPSAQPTAQATPNEPANPRPGDAAPMSGPSKMGAHGMCEMMMGQGRGMGMMHGAAG